MEQTLYKQIGLGTPAGRALFLLYGGAGAGREAGLAYSERNRQRLAAQKQRQGAAGSNNTSQQQQPQPQQQKKLRAAVAAPRVGRRSKDGAQLTNSKTPPRAQRRPAGAILATLRADAAEAAAALPPAPGRRLVGEAEKERCALQFQFRGKPPQQPQQQPQQSQQQQDGNNGRDNGEIAAAPATPRAALQARFDELGAEVEELTAWLDGMRRDGLAARGEAEAAVRHEIAVRAAEMARLHAALLAGAAV